MKRGALVHALRFTDSVALARAFEEIASHEFVEDCLIDLEALRIRFIAAAEPARTLIERIYLHGGLAFSTRHRVRLRAIARRR
jgi:hypothetical protein